MSEIEYKGNIKGFPIEVVEWMLQQQENQGNKRNVKVFEHWRMAPKKEGGFDWGRVEGVDYTFVFKVIDEKNFDLFFERFVKNQVKAEPTTIDKIKKWVKDRNLHKADPKVQMCKTIEELGELARAINKNDMIAQMDGIGDTVITLICISEQLGLDFNACVDYAYNEIKDRKGKLVKGVFVKESDLT